MFLISFFICSLIFHGFFVVLQSFCSKYSRFILNLLPNKERATLRGGSRVAGTRQMMMCLTGSDNVVILLPTELDLVQMLQLDLLKVSLNFNNIS